VASQGTWTAIIPIRSFIEGKTRLHLPSVDTFSIIEAFADDVILACSTCPQITRTVVVSPDPDVLAHATDRGCEVLVEEAATGINEAINAVRGETSGPCIAILGDIPCLDATTLTMVLSQAHAHEVSFIADTMGVGSTMWCAQSDSPATSHFGHHSRAEHRAHGAVELGARNASAQWARARRDVDTDVDLWDAMRLGMGPASTSLLAGLRNNQ
jgi:2-phospho-L-lactate/phosphoenolpyruvate guanylyltransferase